MPPPTTAEQLLELVSKSGLLDPPQLQAYARHRAAGALPATPQKLADALVRDGLLMRRHGSGTFVVKPVSRVQQGSSWR